MFWMKPNKFVCSVVAVCHVTPWIRQFVTNVSIPKFTIKPNSNVLISAVILKTAFNVIRKASARNVKVGIRSLVMSAQNAKLKDVSVVSQTHRFVMNKQNA